MLDGEKVDNEKKFSNGCMFPGDPNGPAAEVYNCRCTLIAAVDGIDTSNAKRRVRNPETGESVLIENMSYAEWAGWKKKAAVEEKQYAMQATTKAEAEEVAKRFGVNADYSKYDISVANAMNETMQQYVNIFGKHAFDNLEEISAFSKGEKLHEWGGYSSKNRSIKIRGVNSKNAIEKFGEKMQKYQDGFFSSDSNLHIIRHELGHAVHDVVEGNILSELRKYQRSVSLDIIKDVSYRADWDDYEFVAECLAQYLNGHPSKIATEVVKIIKNGFKKKFG